ncbi:MAG: ABC transporter substrate-binding protein [Candidatus Aminicenantes bacterium]|nr:ABC transporter substrate-binding protein [Candidatus Aminicenantes bacterium]
MIIKKSSVGKTLYYAALPVLLCVSVLLISCNSGAVSAGRADTITVMQSSVAIGDPHICSDSSNRLSLISNIYEALVKRDQNGHYQPSLAESWNVEEDGITWTFKLRSGVPFHNGDILNAEDVAATLGRVLDPAIGGAFGTQGVYSSYLGSAKISAVDPLTVQITTEKPMADLLDLLVAMPISPKSELDKLPQKYVGSGPYKISEQTDTKVILKAFDAYWGKTPVYKKIHWIAESNPEKRVEALKTGRADIVSGLTHKDAEQLKNDKAAALYELKSGLCIIFMCNAQQGPCKDRRVRQALNYALDVDTIIKEIKHGAATPLNGYLTPHHFGYNPETPLYPYDPEKARSLLVEAGYGEGLELVFDIPSVMPDEAPQLARMMAEQLKKAGITVDIIEHKDRAAYSEMVREKNIHDACCFDSSPLSTYRVLCEKIQSTRKGPWWQGYKNEEVDNLIEQTEAAFNNSERQQIYRRIYTIIRDDAPWIFLYRPTRFFGVSPSLKGWKLRTDGLLLFD